MGALIPTIILGLLFMGIPQELQDPKQLENAGIEVTD
jgi:hypothetical protein